MELFSDQNLVETRGRFVMEQKITGVYVIFVHERAMFLAEMISFVVNLSSLARDGQH